MARGNTKAARRAAPTAGDMIVDDVSNCSV
jgi:hypothetical protein